MADIRTIIYRTEDFSEALKAEIVALCLEAHQDQEFQFMFTKYFLSGGRHALGYLNDQLVGHAVATTRYLRIPTGQRLKTAYIDAVSTDPAVQRRGVGTAVMQALAEAIRDHEIGALETSRTTFYEGAGWLLWTGPLAGVKDGVVTKLPDQDGVMILRLPQTPALDLAGTLAVEYDGRFW